MRLARRFLFLSFLAAPLAIASPSAQVRALDANNAAALKVGAVEQQLQKIDLNAAFTAAALTSPARLAQGRATLERLRSLTAQRRDIARRQTDEVAAIKASAPAALASIDNYLGQGQRVHEELHTARINVADAGDAVLAWAAEQQGSMRLENGRLRMQSPAQQRQFNDLFAVLEVAMARHDKAVDASEAHRKAHQGRLNGQPIPAQGKPPRTR